MYGKEITLDEMKKIELDIMKEIHKICEEQNINYFLSGGTLLGAVRHKGFIPWDDDIDILLPRTDYERFIDYCINNETPFKLICNKTDPNYGYLFAKAVDTSTVLIEDFANKNGSEMGVFVDIFPLDGVGDTMDEAIKQLNKTRFYRELLIAANWKRFARSKTKAWYYEPIRFAFFVLSRFFSYKSLIDKIESKYPKENFESKKYSACICGAYRNKEICLSETYTEYIMLPFEDCLFRCPKKYENYLINVYGDYMKLPPEEKRITHHSFKAYYKSEK